MKLLNNKAAKVLALACLSLALLITSGYAYWEWTQLETGEPVQYALVDGNVERPGYYKITEFTTNYDLLLKAGLNDSSEINHIQLIQAANPEQAIEVEVSKEKVAAKAYTKFFDPKVVYFEGNVTVKKELKIANVRYEQVLEEQDRLYTKADGKARISFKNLAEMDVNINTSIKIMNMDDEGEIAFTKIKLENGSLWIKVPKDTPGSVLIIETPTAELSLPETEGEFIISAKPEESSIHAAKGAVTVKEIKSGKSTVLLENQIIVLNSNIQDLDPLQQNFAEDAAKEAFGDLDKSLARFKKSREEASMLLTSHGFNMLISLIPNKKRMVIMDIPKNTYVGDYVDGIFKLDQSLLLAGSEITRGVVERLLGRPVQYVVDVAISDLYAFAGDINNLNVEVDGSAALVLGIPAGLQMLNKDKIIQFLDPKLPGGYAAAVTRQKKVFYAYLKKIKQEGVGKSAATIMSLVSRLRTNLSAKDALKYFEMYTAEANWQVLNIQMPSKQIIKGNLVMQSPDYGRINRLYTQ